MAEKFRVSLQKFIHAPNFLERGKVKLLIGCLCESKFSLMMEDTFTYVLQHMDVLARISKWIVQLQEFDYTMMVEESTRAALADILTHQFREKKEKKEPK